MCRGSPDREVLAASLLARHPTTMLVDVHAHHSPKAYLNAMARLAGAERPRGWASLPHTDSEADVQSRLELMDEADVQVQVLSHGIMAPYLAAESAALEAARACNDGYSDLSYRYPDRFAAL